MINEERIIKVARLFGNGAHIFVPKEWAGEKIVLIKPKSKILKERIIEVLEPYFEYIVGAYLYGSYSRKEQLEDSDIDLFLITNKSIKIKQKGFEILCCEEKNIKKLIKLEPLIIYSILSEAKTIINSELLKKLQEEYKPNLRDFINFFKETKKMIEVQESIVESEKEDYVSSEAVIYSLVLRLRGLFIIKSIIKNEQYSHREFKEWIINTLPNIHFNFIYDLYRASKNESRVKEKIKLEDVKSLIEFLKEEVCKLENDKKREKA